MNVRFSIASGVPDCGRKRPGGDGSAGDGHSISSGRRNIHTDIVAHSHDGFPVHTPEEFLEFVRAAAASGSSAPPPPPIVAFLATHPAAKSFVEAPKPLPVSFTRQAYFAVTAFKFTNADGCRSVSADSASALLLGSEFLTEEQAAKKPADFLDAEMATRLATRRRVPGVSSVGGSRRRDG